MKSHPTQECVVELPESVHVLQLSFLSWVLEEMGQLC